jgi:hypothetical protein
MEAAGGQILRVAEVGAIASERTFTKNEKCVLEPLHDD